MELKYTRRYVEGIEGVRPGYEELFFDTEQPLEDEAKMAEINLQLQRDFGITNLEGFTIDWRDNQTCWLWYGTVEPRIKPLDSGRNDNVEKDELPEPIVTDVERAVDSVTEYLMGLVHEYVAEMQEHEDDETILASTDKQRTYDFVLYLCMQDDFDKEKLIKELTNTGD